MQQLATDPDIRLVRMQPPYSFTSPFGGEAFLLLLHSDDSNIPPETMPAFADQVIASGCRYVCCSGVECERWHDVMDWAYISSDPDFDPPNERFVPTTWHNDETLDEVVWFVLNCAVIEDAMAKRVLIVLLHSQLSRSETVIKAVSETVV